MKPPAAPRTADERRAAETNLKIETGRALRGEDATADRDALSALRADHDALKRSMVDLGTAYNEALAKIGRLEDELARAYAAAGRAVRR